MENLQLILVTVLITLVSVAVVGSIAYLVAVVRKLKHVVNNHNTVDITNLQQTLHNEVTELHNFTTIEGVFTLLGVVGGYLHSWKINGDHESLLTSPNDLFIVSKVIRKYQNVYYNSSTNDMFVGKLLYDSNEQAKQNIDIWNQHTYIKTIEITHEIY